mgnify:FL=1
MIWGSVASQQVPIGPWALIILGFILGVCAVRAKSSRAAQAVPFVVALMVPVLSVMATGPLNVFENGQRADAEAVNENFSILDNALAAALLDISTLEAAQDSTQSVVNSLTVGLLDAQDLIGANASDIGALQLKDSDLETQITNIPAGPEGPQGPPGPQGP